MKDDAIVDELDSFLAVIDNPIRRKILKIIAKGKQYQLSLSRELHISPQAVAKHLKVLEASGFIECDVVKENSAGPPRKYYLGCKSRTLVVDISPRMFNTRLISIDKRRPRPEVRDDWDESYEKIKCKRAVNAKLAACTKLIRKIDDEMRRLELQRHKLLGLREALLCEIEPVLEQLLKADLQDKLIEYLISDIEGMPIDHEDFDIWRKLLRDIAKRSMS